MVLKLTVVGTTFLTTELDRQINSEYVYCFVNTTYHLEKNVVPFGNAFVILGKI